MATFKTTTSGRSLLNKKKQDWTKDRACGTPVLIANSGDDFLPKITLSLQPLRKEEIIIYTISSQFVK